MTADRPTITLRPDPVQWRGLVAKARIPSPQAPPRDDRRALGLPTDRPIVMSGHQPTRWHAGILAKLLAACELARSANAHAAWIVPDMDEVDPTTTRVPQGRAEQARVRFVRLLTGDPPGPGVPAGVLAPRDPAPPDPDMPGFADALAAFRHEPSMAMQVGRAVVRTACERFGLPEPTVLSASDLRRTGAWAELLRALADDPRACVEAYNNAARAHPDAEVRALGIETSRVELPLWRVRPDLPRLAVFSDQLGAIPPDQLRPRALAMSAIVRAALADLFIHGLGGERYDRVTEAWLTGWPHAPAWTLAPTAVATADARPDLGLDPGDLPDPARARWLAHHARHDPALVGDETAARTKADIVDLIRTLKFEGEDPAPAFAQLQTFLGEHRERHARRLAELDAAADRAERLQSVRDLALDRTWPWPVLEKKTLDSLHQQIRDALAPATIPRCTERSACS
ncbi:MAG: hypothetical protein LAT64_10720 [Phycisphaerales bacterium]|nr:hypothetical protein [Planctomycetota bacterium]MCH8509224.1 hypothetical protein [Phycisphaerales bacterium]